jgi:hypothetical protein
MYNFATSTNNNNDGNFVNDASVNNDDRPSAGCGKRIQLI